LHASPTSCHFRYYPLFFLSSFSTSFLPLIHPHPLLSPLFLPPSLPFSAY
jgi:hypothetical protein